MTLEPLTDADARIIQRTVEKALKRAVKVRQRVRWQIQYGTRDLDPDDDVLRFDPDGSFTITIEGQATP